jgi:hypothetical protein
MTVSGAIGSDTTRYATDGQGGVDASPANATIINGSAGGAFTVNSILVTAQSVSAHSVEIVKFDGSSFSPAFSVPIPAAPAQLPYLIPFGATGARITKPNGSGGFGVKVPDLSSGTLTVTVFFTPGD